MYVFKHIRYNSAKALAYDIVYMYYTCVLCSGAYNLATRVTFADRHFINIAFDDLLVS